MVTFQKNVSMSDDSAYRLAKMLFGLDRALSAMPSHENMNTVKNAGQSITWKGIAQSAKFHVGAAPVFPAGFSRAKRPRRPRSIEAAN
jgi:hypothetical protein